MPWPQLWQVVAFPRAGSLRGIALGRKAWAISAHVGRWDDLEPLVDACYERFGKIDILVNNAGMSPLYDSVDTVSEELFDIELDFTWANDSSIDQLYLQFQPGVKVVYEKFKEYKPRSEPIDWQAGGKVVKVDRVEWITMPDAQTAVNALQSGDIDFMENGPFDLLPILSKDPETPIRKMMTAAVM